jgi:hypothetical protein
VVELLYHSLSHEFQGYFPLALHRLDITYATSNLGT